MGFPRIALCNRNPIWYVCLGTEVSAETPGVCRNLLFTVDKIKSLQYIKAGFKLKFVNVNPGSSGVVLNCNITGLKKGVTVHLTNLLAVLEY